MINFLNHIQCFENILDPAICDKIIKNSEDKTFFSSGTEGDRNKNDYRKCYDTVLDKKYDNYIFEAVGKALTKYKEKVPYFNTGLSMEDTGYVHLLYKGSQNGEYKIHIDQLDIYQRIISISFILII